MPVEAQRSISGDLYDVPLDVSYEADVWGSIRRSVAANAAVAQASPRRISRSARLLYQSELASDYFQVQGLDADRVLLEQTVRSYEQYLQLTQDRFQGGVVSMADVALAQTQLEGARAQLTDVGIARAQFEHAIAVLTGHAPSELSIPPATTEPLPPTVPVGLPSSLLERRPDIAAAERQSGSRQSNRSELPKRGVLSGHQSWWQCRFSGGSTSQTCSRHRRDCGRSVCRLPQRSSTVAGGARRSR